MESACPPSNAVQASGKRPAHCLISLVVEVVPLRATCRADKRLVGHAFPRHSEAADIAKAEQPSMPLGAPLVLNDPSARRAQRPPLATGGLGETR